jgi:hypothetical protein
MDSARKYFNLQVVVYSRLRGSESKEVIGYR